VDAVLQAAAYILVRQGYEGLTTNKVAERAGVNIASLYQYFPNKEAIVVELQRRHVAEARARMPDAVVPLQAQPDLRTMLALVVDAAVAEHQIAPALHRIFSEELPRSVRAGGDDASVEAFWRSILEPFARNVPDLSIASFITRVSLHAIIHEAAARRPELLDDPRLVPEVVMLLERYLKRPTQKPTRSNR
jgi:AcrR family transcriptional regulator